MPPAPAAPAALDAAGSLGPAATSGPRGTAWQRFWARAPRRLRATPAGRALLAITVGCGLLALSSGNNLLFLAWGLQLGTVLVSGVVSELSLRPLRLTAQLPTRARVGERAHLALQLHHAGQFLPSFALQLSARIEPLAARTWARAPYVLRLAAGETRTTHAGFVPTRRGPLVCARLVARTGYPFGLFVKERSFNVCAAPGWVWPRPQSAPWLLSAVDAALGEAPANRVGAGDDFFALRAFRPGDAPARVLWRRAAAGRPLHVRETELLRAERVTLVLQLDAALAEGNADAVGEHTLGLVAGLAEALGARGMAVGLVTHGACVPAAHVPGAAGLPAPALDALAALDWHRPLPPLPWPARSGSALQLVGLAAVAGGAAGPLPQVRLDAAGSASFTRPGRGPGSGASLGAAAPLDRAPGAGAGGTSGGET